MSFNFSICRKIPPNNFFPNPPFDGSERPWSRARGFQSLNTFTNDQLNMRRKAEILKYKNNDANLSKKQIYSRRARGIGVEQKSWASQPFISGNTSIIFDNKSINSNTNPNIRNLKRIENILICPSKKNPICNPASNSDVPGNKELCYDKSVPLVGYNEEISYSNIGTKWPQHSYLPDNIGNAPINILKKNIYNKLLMITGKYDNRNIDTQFILYFLSSNNLQFVKNDGTRDLKLGIEFSNYLKVGKEYLFDFSLLIRNENFRIIFTIETQLNDIIIDDQLQIYSYKIKNVSSLEDKPINYDHLKNADHVENIKLFEIVTEYI